MTNTLQPLDRSCFGHAKILFRRQIFHIFCAVLSPTKARFFGTYTSIRKEAYSSKTIMESWRRCGLLENYPDVALCEYRRQMHHNIVTPENPVQEESVIVPEVEKDSIPASQTKLRKRKEGLKILKSYYFLKQMLL